MAVQWIERSAKVAASNADVALAQALRVNLPEGRLVFAGLMNETRAGDFGMIEFYVQDTKTWPLKGGVLKHNRIGISWEGNLPVMAGQAVQGRIPEGATQDDTVRFIVGVEVA